MNEPEDELNSIVWITPYAQRRTVTEELAIAVAEDVVRGATLLSAAAKYGISRSKLMRWLDWGMEADADGAGPEDIHAPYLDFYLKVLQAQGIASVRAQIAAATYHPQWWLQNHPETRGEYGGDVSGQLLLAAPTVGGTEAVVVQDVTPDEETMRSVLRTMIEAGMAVAPEERLHVVEADGSGATDLPTETTDEDRQVG